MGWFLPQMFNSTTIVALAGNGLAMCSADLNKLLH